MDNTAIIESPGVANPTGQVLALWALIVGPASRERRPERSWEVLGLGDPSSPGY